MVIGEKCHQNIGLFEKLSNSLKLTFFNDLIILILKYEYTHIHGHYWGPRLGKKD